MNFGAEVKSHSKCYCFDFSTLELFNLINYVHHLRVETIFKSLNRYIPTAHTYPFIPLTYNFALNYKK